jgi:hypothetical protein
MTNIGEIEISTVIAYQKRVLIQLRLSSSESDDILFSTKLIEPSSTCIQFLNRFQK